MRKEVTNVASAMLTTTDNPYNPFTQFDEWWAYDTQMGYNTVAYLDRICKTSHELEADDYLNAINKAIDEIMKFNITGNYKVVYQD